jgi:hypothetical protein
VVGLVIVVLFVVAIAAVALVSLFGQAERDEGGAVTDAGSLEAAELQVGDCFDEPSGVSSDAVSEVFTVEAKPCGEPHDFEVFHSYESRRPSCRATLR